MPHTPKIPILALLLLVAFEVVAGASEEYSIEQSFEHPVSVPSSVAVLLKNRLDLEKRGCSQTSMAEALEATEVDVGSTSRSLLVKPNAEAMCLCGAYYCPAWLFAVKPGGASQLWFTAGTSYIQILDLKFNGYKLLRSGGGTAGHGLVETWIWRDGSYHLSRRKSWTATK